MGSYSDDEMKLVPDAQSHNLACFTELVNYNVLGDPVIVYQHILAKKRLHIISSSGS